MKKINYIDNEKIDLLFLRFPEEVREYRKKTPVFARHVRPDEIETTLITYISDPNNLLNYKVETECTLAKDMIIVRNIEDLRDSVGNPLYDKENKPIHNEYAMPMTTFIKNYGDIAQLSEKFDKKFHKKITIKAIEVNDEVISFLNEKSKSSTPSEIRIKTSWGDELLEHGGLLVAEYYAISKIEYQKTYLLVNATHVASASRRDAAFFAEKPPTASLNATQEDLKTKSDTAPSFLGG